MNLGKRGYNNAQTPDNTEPQDEQWYTIKEIFTPQSWYWAQMLRSAQQETTEQQRMRQDKREKEKSKKKISEKRKEKYSEKSQET